MTHAEDPSTVAWQVLHSWTLAALGERNDAVSESLRESAWRVVGQQPQPTWPPLQPALSNVFTRLQDGVKDCWQPPAMLRCREEVLFPQKTERPPSAELKEALQLGLAVTAALSSALSRFFEGWVGELCRQRNQQGKGGIYAVYSGGDDLFLVGSWHLIPELAQQIRNDFIRYATGTEPYHLRVTLLSAELEQIATDWTLAVLAPLDLDGLAWRITARANSSAEHSWVGSASYQELAQPLLSRPNQLPSVWTFQLASPTTFRQRGLNVPLPLPDLVFGSLLEQWNASSELALPDEVRRFAAECLAINRYELRSVASPTSGGVVQIGAVGRCSFRAINLDRYRRACIDVLARFAFFSGIGASTTRGCGQARLLTKTDQPRQREAADNGDPLPD